MISTWIVALRAHRDVGVLSVLSSAPHVVHTFSLQFGHLTATVGLQCFQIIIDLANSRQKRVVHVCIGSTAGLTVSRLILRGALRWWRLPLSRGLLSLVQRLLVANRCRHDHI